MVKTKTCTRCHEDKSTTEFYGQKKGKYGVASWCKLCSKAYHAQPETKARNNALARKRMETPEAKAKKRIASKKYFDKPGVKKMRRLKSRVKHQAMMLAPECPVASMNWVKRKLTTIKDRNRQRGFFNNITAEDLLPLPKYCPVRGVELHYGGPIGDDNASVDRIDNSKGYERGNVAVISLRANKLKSTGTLDEIEALASYMREKTV